MYNNSPENKYIIRFVIILFYGKPNVFWKNNAKIAVKIKRSLNRLERNISFQPAISLKFGLVA